MSDPIASTQEMKMCKTPAMSAQGFVHVKGKKPQDFLEDNDDLVENGFETSIQVTYLHSSKFKLRTNSLSHLMITTYIRQ